MSAACPLEFAGCRPIHSQCLKPAILIAALVVAASNPLSADLYRSGCELIPGTEGIELVDGVNVDGMDLEHVIPMERPCVLPSAQFCVAVTATSCRFVRT